MGEIVVLMFYAPSHEPINSAHDEFTQIACFWLLRTRECVPTVQGEVLGVPRAKYSAGGALQCLFVWAFREEYGVLGRCKVAARMVYQPKACPNVVDMTSFIRDLLSRTISSISFFPVLSISLSREREVLVLRKAHLVGCTPQP